MGWLTLVVLLGAVPIPTAHLLAVFALAHGVLTLHACSRCVFGHVLALFITVSHLLLTHTACC